MPAVARSFYANEAHGHRYWDFLSEELPELVGRFFRVSDRREDTFVAGLSMGGYGALKWALKQPGRFAAAASLSGALDVVALAALPERRELPDRIFGGPPGPDDDLFAMLEECDAEALPSLYVACGTEDQLWDSCAFLRRAEGSLADRDAGTTVAIHGDGAGHFVATPPWLDQPWGDPETETEDLDVRRRLWAAVDEALASLDS